MFAFNDEYLIKSMMSLVRDETKRIESLGLAPQEDLRVFIKQAVQQAIDKVTGGADDSVALETITLLHKNLSAVHLPGDFLKITKSAGEKLSDALAVDQAAGEFGWIRDDWNALLDRLGDLDPADNNVAERLQKYIQVGNTVINSAKPATTDAEFEKILQLMLQWAQGLIYFLNWQGAFSDWGNDVQEAQQAANELTKKLVRAAQSVLGNQPSVEETLKPGERIASVESQAIKKICSILDHITYTLGSQGNHEAAYLTEKTRFKIETLIDRNNK